ncbi:hypothetical protein B0H67DRAFT_595501 [Lasiosphaeris hirsuta]|uniref:FAS1 domain-containing protein n=1 Tax=Lasiosphaeris hirsuta TaxID=260670 RepID=A0AA39ZRJ4_9PEZI|nr:hypothetical protein B0H67DRAFT_595501 [Lasiosphaeris hirsuta]
MSKLRLIPGTVISTSDKTANLNGDPQVVVSDSRSTDGSVTIASGQGNRVNVIKSDLSFAGGLIHVTDGLFTTPQLLSKTVRVTRKTFQFSSLLTRGQANASSLDYTPRITVFIPSDSAFAATGGFGTAAKQVLDGHVVVSPGTTQKVGYLPNLKSGQVLTTSGGGTLAVKVQGGDYFIGGAKIEQANLILPNGVAHIVSKVLTPVVAAAASRGATTAHVNSMCVAVAVAVATFLVDFC